MAWPAASCWPRALWRSHLPFSGPELCGLALLPCWPGACAPTLLLLLEHGPVAWLSSPSWDGAPLPTQLPTLTDLFLLCRCCVAPTFCSYCPGVLVARPSYSCWPGARLPMQLPMLIDLFLLSWCLVAPTFSSCCRPALLILPSNSPRTPHPRPLHSCTPHSSSQHGPGRSMQCSVSSDSSHRRRKFPSPTLGTVPSATF